MATTQTIDTELIAYQDAQYGTQGLTGMTRELVLSLVGAYQAVELMEQYGQADPSYNAGMMSMASSILDALRKHDARGYRVAIEYRDRAKLRAEAEAKLARAAAAKARRRERELALARQGKVECDRCGGRGGWEGWPGFTCFKCAGQGSYAATSKGDRAYITRIQAEAVEPERVAVAAD